MKACALLCLLVGVTTASVARAEDTAAVMAALKDTKAECHYLETLCQRINGADDALDAAVEGLKNGRGTQAQADAAAAAAQLNLYRVLADLNHASDVMKAKHEGKLPPCVKTLHCARDTKP